MLVDASLFSPELQLSSFATIWAVRCTWAFEDLVDDHPAPWSWEEQTSRHDLVVHFRPSTDLDRQLGAARWGSSVVVMWKGKADWEAELRAYWRRCLQGLITDTASSSIESWKHAFVKQTQSTDWMKAMSWRDYLSHDCVVESLW